MSDEDGYCAGHTVYMDEGRQSSSVLGPDGEPITYVRRKQAVGFDLRQQAPLGSKTKGKAT